MLYFVKLAISASLIVLISEVSKRYSLIGGIIASIPVVSVLSMVWLYHETSDLERVSSFSTSVFWMVIPSLVLFVVLPQLLTNGFGFYLSLFISCVLTIASYYLMLVLLGYLGINLD